MKSMAVLAFYDHVQGGKLWDVKGVELRTHQPTPSLFSQSELRPGINTTCAQIEHNVYWHLFGRMQILWENKKMTSAYCEVGSFSFLLVLYNTSLALGGLSRLSPSPPVKNCPSPNTPPQGTHHHMSVTAH
jgi:hypothetical protein